MLFVAFAAALSTVPHSQTKPSDQANATIEAKEPQPETIWESVSGGDAVATVTSLLVVVAAIQAAMFFRQLYYMKEALDDASIATKAAQLSAEAAATANRPWLRIITELDGQLIFGPKGVSLKTVVEVENVGRSPAVRVKVSTGIGITDNRGGYKVDGVQSAVSKAQISTSERITYDRGRTSDELERIMAIGDVVFPGEWRPMETVDWIVSKDELFGPTTNEDDRTFDGVFYAVSAEYRVGTGWGVTTVVHAIEQAPDGGFRVNSRSELKFDVILRKLQIHTTAT